ncbi:hypothetical protein PMG11_09725 [Penicillium brasilianum]|uniref:Myb-like domain-containing protein n=1 Tax=Penicillium brasilianum TaxID=104259 RepID=A0A0F7U1M5_PENBI|nr:hypothetical protein PMG11_09725 [Penicillium brasilianum]
MPSTRKGGGEALPGNTGKPARKEKRQLVRWDQDLDTLLLLTVQSACNLTGVKVPWEKVAQLMGPKFTEGAIVQHLSKLRIRREAAGQRVPPPLRRSVTAAAAASGGGKGSKAGRRSARKRKGHSGGVEDDSSDDLGAPGEDDSDPEYFQGKKKRKSGRYALSTSKKPKMTMEDDDEEDEDALMCGGAPFLQHLQPDTYHDGSDSDDSDEDLDEDFDSDSCTAKTKVEQASPTSRPSRVVKLPVSLQTQDQHAMKSIRSNADANPPPSTTMAGNWSQTFMPNTPAVMSNNPVPSYGNQGAYYPSQMATGQGTGNPLQATQNQFYWPLPTPVVNSQILGRGEFTWSPHAPAFASGRGGILQVSGPPPPNWGPAPAPATADEAPTQAMGLSSLNPGNPDPNSWFMDSSLFMHDDDDDDDDEAQGSHNQHLGQEEY